VTSTRRTAEERPVAPEWRAHRRNLGLTDPSKPEAEGPQPPNRRSRAHQSVPAPRAASEPPLCAPRPRQRPPSPASRRRRARPAPYLPIPYLTMAKPSHHAYVVTSYEMDGKKDLPWRRYAAQVTTRPGQITRGPVRPRFRTFSTRIGIDPFATSHPVNAKDLFGSRAVIPEWTDYFR
jgi:hypothetical protein